MSTTSIHVTLPKALKEHMEKRVAEGEFTSPSDYVRALVRAERDHRQKREVLLRDIDAGIEDIDAAGSMTARRSSPSFWARRSRSPKVWRGSPSRRTPGRI